MIYSIIKHLSEIIITFILAVFLFELSLERFTSQEALPAPSLLEQKYGVNLTRANLDPNKQSIIKSNSNHIRSTYETPYEKKVNTFRILTLGDSVSLGLGVGDEETWTFHLERLLNDLNLGVNFEVLNAGALGQSKPTRHFLYLKNEGYKFSPDLVIIGRTEFEMNSGMGKEVEITNIREEETNDKKLKIFLDGINIVPHRNYYPTWLLGQIRKLPFYDSRLGSSHIYRRFRSDMNDYLESKSTLDADYKNKLFHYLNGTNWEAYKEISLVFGPQEFKVFDTKSNVTLPYLNPGNIIRRKNKIENATHFAMGYVGLNEIINLVSGWGGKTLLMEIPVFADVMDFTKDTNYLPEFKNQDSVYSFSLADDFIRFQKTYPTPLHIYDDNHWAPGGHYLAAQVIYNYLISNRLIPVKKGSSSLIEIGAPKTLEVFNKIRASLEIDI
jgi:hypothetical protein